VLLRFEPIEAKLAVPVIRAGMVPRASLVAGLRAAAEPLIVLTAPAGYGKTTLLGQWREEDPRPFAWVSLDPSDGDPIALLTYVAAALDRVEPLDAGVFAALRSPGPSIWSSVIPRLGSALATRGAPVVLVLDDVHCVEGGESVDAIAGLVDHVPRGSSLVVSGRGEPPIGLSRLRARGLVREVGVDELRFGAEDAAGVFRGAGLELAEDAVASFTESTEGWPAGLYLAALSLRTRRAQMAARRLSGSDRLLGDYFREELLDQLSAADVDFLSSTSVLERMSGPLCDAVLEREGSAALLDSFERSNLFLVPLDERGEWYRYHALFRDLLGAELVRRAPERVGPLNRRASVWSAGNGDPEAAVAYARASGDTGLLADLVTAYALPFYNTGRLATARRWLSWFDDDDRTRYVPIAILGSWVHLLTGEVENGERWARSAELGAPAYNRPLPGGSPASAWVAVLRAARCPDGPAQMAQDAAEAIETLAPQSVWHPHAHMLHGIAHVLTGDDEAADSLLAEAVDIGVATGAASAAHALGQRALLALKRGNVELAGRYLEEAERLSGSLYSDYAAHAIAVAARARVLQLTHAPEGASRALADAQRLRPLLTWGFPWNAVQVRLELARVYLGVPDPGACRLLLREVDEIVARRPDLGVLGEAISDVKGRLASHGDADGGWASTLTAAELRLLPLLTTHLSYQEIGDRLYLSRNTVKTEALSAYRKLSASNRSEAVANAIQLGLLEETRLPAATLLH